MPIDSSDRIKVGVLLERASGERRVALIPADIRKLNSKATFIVESGAGREAGFDDDTYIGAGARMAAQREILEISDVVVKIRPPGANEIPLSGRTLVSLGGRDPYIVESLRKRSVIHLALERIPRTTRAQAMDVLSSQASIAGYASVLEGARALGVMLPMLITAAGTIKPARMIALGAGVAGLQAIATARRLGAIVHGFDVREAAREQVESLGARFVSPGEAVKAQDAANGYAADQSADEQAALRRALAPTLAQMQLIVTSAQIPGRAAPLLIDDEVLARLAPGTVIIDLAAETGGNTSRTEPGETVTTGGVKIIGSVNLPSQMAADASRLFSGNVRALLEHLIPEETSLQLRLDDPIIAALLGADPTLRTAA